MFFSRQHTALDLRELHVIIEECFCNSDSDYLSYLVNLFSRNPNRLHYESNFLNDMNFLQSTNFLRIWGCNLSHCRPAYLVTWREMTSWHEAGTEEKQCNGGGGQTREDFSINPFISCVKITSKAANFKNYSNFNFIKQTNSSTALHSHVMAGIFL